MADDPAGSIFSERLWKACGLQRILLDVPRHTFFGGDSEPSTSGRSDSAAPLAGRTRRVQFSLVDSRPFLQLPAEFSSIPRPTASGAKVLPAQPPQPLAPPQHPPGVAASPPQPAAETWAVPGPEALMLLHAHPRSSRTGRRHRANSAKLLLHLSRLLGGDACELPSGSSGSSFLQPPVVVSSDCVSSPTDSGSDGVYPAPAALRLSAKRSATPETSCAVQQLAKVAHLELLARPAGHAAGRLL